MLTCICGTKLTVTIKGVLPCRSCINDSVQASLEAHKLIQGMATRQSEILKNRRSNLIKIMEAKPNVRKVTVKK